MEKSSGNRYNKKADWDLTEMMKTDLYKPETSRVNYEQIEVLKGNAASSKLCP